MEKIARIFPSRTRATPVDGLTFYGPPPMFLPPIDEVHISVLFTWDLDHAEWLAKQWEHVAPVKIGGPATGMRGNDFEPGKYVKPGYVITSRGCPNKCWFCSVWKRDGDIRELSINEGFNILDDNLLACSEKHIENVLDMLRRQKMGQPQFTGGLEAARMTLDIAKELRSVRPKQMFFAYDEPADWEPLVKATQYVFAAGFTKRSHSIRAYVLCGYKGDTIKQAQLRMSAVAKLGITPMAMAWKNKKGIVSRIWKQFQRRWARPAIIHG